MDDLAKKLTELLESPEGLDTIKGLADMLITPKAEASSDHGADTGGLGDLGISPSEIQTFMKMAGALKSDSSDSSASLLYALKPHLSKEKQEKVDKAAKILKLSKLLPLLKEQGIF